MGDGPSTTQIDFSKYATAAPPQIDFDKYVSAPPTGLLHLRFAMTARICARATISDGWYARGGAQ